MSSRVATLLSRRQTPSRLQLWHRWAGDKAPGNMYWLQVQSVQGPVQKNNILYVPMPQPEQVIPQ